MTDIQAALDAGALIGEPKTAPGSDIPYALVPDGAQIASLEHLLQNPTLTRRTVALATLESFIAYVQKFSDADSAIFGDPVTMQLTALLDYHRVDEPRWCQHIACYTAPTSLEWQTWNGQDNRPKGQADFAQFLEDNLVDIRNPPGADVLEVCRSLKTKRSVEFLSSVDLANGSEQFTYNETITGETGHRRSNLAVPKDFNLGIPVLLGGEVYAVVARLRYRITDGKLTLWYELYRPAYVAREAFADVIKEVTGATGLAVWQGKA